MLKFMIHEVRALRKELDPNVVIEKRVRSAGRTGRASEHSSASISSSNSENASKGIKTRKKIDRILQRDIPKAGQNTSRSYTEKGEQFYPSPWSLSGELFKPIAPAPPVIRVVDGKRVDTSIVIPVPTSRPSSATLISRDVQDTLQELLE